MHGNLVTSVTKFIFSALILLNGFTLFFSKGLQAKQLKRNAFPAEDSAFYTHNDGRMALKLNRVFKLSKDFLRPKDDSGIEFSEEKVFPKGTLVHISQHFGRAKYKKWNETLPMIVKTSEVIEEDPAHLEADFYLPIDQLNILTETTESLHRSTKWEEFRGGPQKFHYLKSIYTSWTINVFDAVTREMHLARGLNFFFTPHIEKCRNEEVAIIMASWTYTYELLENFPSFAFLGKKDQGKIFCVSVKDVKENFNNPIIGHAQVPTEEFYQKHLSQWNPKSLAIFQQRLGQENHSARIPQIIFNLQKDSNGNFIANYRGALLSACNNECRVQGFDLLLDTNGRLLEVIQETPIGTLYYFDRESREELPFKTGDIKRMIEYSNNIKKLNEIYKLLDHQVFPEQNKFVARMTDILEQNNENNAIKRGIGSSMATFMIALSQAREILAEELDTENNWPSIGDFKFYYFEPEN